MELDLGVVSQDQMGEIGFSEPEIDQDDTAVDSTKQEMEKDVTADDNIETEEKEDEAAVEQEIMNDEITVEGAELMEVDSVDILKEIGRTELEIEQDDTSVLS